MSAQDNGPSMERNPAVRVFASEFEDSDYVFTLSDDDKAPNYTLLPTGKRVNRILAVGAITQVDDYSDEQQSGSGSFVRARLNDGNMNFYLTASQYQPDAAAFLKKIIDDTPMIVAVVGKPNHYETGEGEHRIEVQPETIVEVSKQDREQWVLETARATRDRVERYVEAADGDGEVPDDVEMAMNQYDIDPEQYLDDAMSIIDSFFDTEDETEDEDE